MAVRVTPRAPYVEPPKTQPFYWKFRRHKRIYRALSWVHHARVNGIFGPPALTGPADYSDILPRDRKPADIPFWYLHTPVHRMRGLGFLDPHVAETTPAIVRALLPSQHDYLVNWIHDHVVDAGVEPVRILDVGTGKGSAALAYASVFPDAEVIGIDIAPPQLRFAQRKAAQLGLTVKFWQMDSADLSYFEDESFDVVQLANILHEMPASHIVPTVREAVRVCKTGGMVGVFDYSFPETEAEQTNRRRAVWSGQEPFMLEYLAANPPGLLAELGCEVRQVTRDSAAASWTARKGAESSRVVPDSAASAA